MNYKNLTKKSEDLKRRWLEDICKEYPSHTLTYVPMLTDKKAGKAAVVAKEQREEIVESFLTDMSERVTNKVKVYGQSNIYKKDPLEQMDYFRYMLEEHKLDAGEKEIFFIDPDSGFYEDGIVSRVGETDDKKHISMPHIKLLLFNIENPPIIVCYQYNNRPKQTARIEAGIKVSIEGLGISFNCTSYVSSASYRQAKFFIFKYNPSAL